MSRELNRATESRADGWRAPDGSIWPSPSGYIFSRMAQREGEEEREFERNSRVTTNDQVVTGYGGVATFVDSDGTVYEDDPSPAPDRLERDQVRAHALRSRIRNQRLLRATPRICFGQRRRMPQARRARPPARRSTVSSRDGPGDSGDPHRPSKDDDSPRRVALVPRRYWAEWARRRLRELRDLNRLLEAVPA